jgi:hypothetical protein
MAKKEELLITLTPVERVGTMWPWGDWGIQRTCEIFASAFLRTKPAVSTWFNAVGQRVSFAQRVQVQKLG